ncbi:DNA cytosine methyltransferase [Gordonibacter urolithinfaciens]|uniref:DNA cytosine methyltransferase n=1 Tax=Gordonibacter urolithinfaciens TaxID=1335613 RepID=UPI003AAE4CEE
MPSEPIKYLDIFAGAGGLSEGFMRVGFEPIAHVEKEEAASYTLKTRLAYHWLRREGLLNKYDRYLKGELTREDLYKLVPANMLSSVLTYDISENTIQEVFDKIDEMLGDDEVDLIIGGPPCQAYSLVGRSRDENRMLNDGRNYLYKLYARFLERYKPEYFVFENVVGLLSAKNAAGIRYLDSMIALFDQTGYSIEYKTLDSSDYGVLQKRKRIIIIGKRARKEKGFYPSIEKVQSNVKVKEIFTDLPKLKAGEGSYEPVAVGPYDGTYLIEAGIRDISETYVTYHIARPHCPRDLAIYRLAVLLWNSEHKRLSYKDLPEYLRTHKNLHSFLDRFKVVEGDCCSAHTVVAHIAKDGHYYIHPDINQNRSITPREAARLQSFPDSFHFESKSGKYSRTSAFLQIGNAVPVRMAEQIAKAIKGLYSE